VPPNASIAQWGYAQYGEPCAAENIPRWISIFVHQFDVPGVAFLRRRVREITHTKPVYGKNDVIAEG
jgi:hypothetical protein